MINKGTAYGIDFHSTRSYRDLTRDSIFESLRTTFGSEFSNPVPYIHSGDPLCAVPDPSDFRREYFKYNFFRKFTGKGGRTSLSERIATSMQKFLSSEQRCRSTNSRINPSGFVMKDECPSTNMVFYHARRNISRCLGSFDWDKAIARCDFGPGATTRLRRADCSLNNKLRGAVHLTEQLLPLFEAFKHYKPGLFDECEVVDFNKVVFVPKDDSSERAIAIEPDMNMFFQKAIGSYIRSRLKRTRDMIDLDDQSINQKLARIASLGFGLATLDLSNASDTLATNLVHNLLPIDWVEAIELTRSRYGMLPNGEKIAYEKISSMGNGFTFELESLIFWALARGVIETYGTGNECVSVYGDDIIISSTLAEPLIAILTVAGFETNKAKSYTRGAFYESCGKHYLLGHDVTPVYLRKIPSRHAECIALINELILFASRDGSGLCRTTCVLPLINLLADHLPKWLRYPRAPVSCKGNAIIGDFDECVPRRTKHQFDGFIFEGLITVPRVKTVLSDASILRESLYILDFRSYGDTTRVEQDLHRFGKTVKGSIIAREWLHLGPYIGLR